MKQVRAADLAAWLADGHRPTPRILDVREPWELERCALPGAEHVPLHQVPVWCDDRPPDEAWVVVCHHGIRSQQAVRYLERQGFTAVYNLTGGLAAWAIEVDPAMPRY